MEVSAMAIVRWDPARELDVLQTDVNRLFDAFFQGSGNRAVASGSQRWIPPTDLIETDEAFVLRSDLPGLSEDDLEIELKDGTLTISGERRSEHEDRREGFYRVERSFGRFSRSLDIPSGVDPGSVEAHFENGVLEVRIPKPEQEQPTRIKIGAGRNGSDAAVSASE
jgi:HSP20 family protein